MTASLQSFRLRRRGATTLVELAFFGAIASIVAIAMVGLFARGNRLLELGRRSSASMEDLRVLLETLTHDAEELAYLEGPQPFDSEQAAAGPAFALVVRSSRVEDGLAATPAGTLRRIEYRLGPPGPGGLRVCTRSVAYAASGGGPPSAGTARVVATALKRLRVEPLVAVPHLPPAPGSPLWTLAAASDPVASTKGSAVLCLLVDVTAGEPPGVLSAEQTTQTSVAVKLWCRNRLLQLPRGGTR